MGVKSEKWLLLRRRRNLITYLVADGLEGDGRNHHDHKVEDPVSTCGESVGWGADLEGDDFRGVSANEVSNVVKKEKQG